MARRYNASDIKQIGKERITTLFKEAAESFKKHPERSHRYVTLALRIAAKTHVKIPLVYRRRFCKHCKSYLVSGINARVRTKEGKLIIYCQKCKHYKRILLKSKTK
jgi:ribonuclease P protein subunit RPR2|tara:strand:+ start:577 stop:894 length:318 start_codon:yes stop_codon:yes gene_type:complete